ncbi:hypothetical protein BOTBODRAFT_180496 [Botryobasidium botryosum FD-172 SS1]|uniref:BTB domain-containing protein n=1 Tax=Botryobasidium botryosum (strain FD-172 SS1) TaxID=930990 RepID=A0A067M7R1_BOTB1|nr:hypothetical protein BOTBODRAFT_180496 [Botryobasidium botryosum FD-172 SS1]
MAGIQQSNNLSPLAAPSNLNELPNESLRAHSELQTPEAPTSPQPSSKERYPNRYFEGGHVILCLGPKSSLFRVQRSVLAKYSATFGDMFSLPPPEGSTAEGSSDDNPIHLPDDPDHFAGVLSIYYGTVLMPHPSDLTFEYVTGVLHVAHKYEFALAIEWAWSNLSARWSWQAEPWRTALSKLSQTDVKRAVALVRISYELDNNRLLGSAFYLLCIDEKWSGDERVYGEMGSEDLHLLLKATRKLYSLWAEKSRAPPAPSAVGASPLELFGTPQPAVVGSPSAYAAVPSSPQDAWQTFIRDSSTISAIFEVLGLTFPPAS